MKAKSIVLTGFGAQEEASLSSRIAHLGGIVKNSVSRKTDILVFNPEYGYGTKKYGSITSKRSKAMELNNAGANIEIIAIQDFEGKYLSNSMSDSGASLSNTVDTISCPSTNIKDCFSTLTNGQKTYLLKDFFNRIGIPCHVHSGRLLIGDSFELFITLKGKSGIKISVEVWKKGDWLNGLEMEQAIIDAKLKVLKYVGFDDIFCDCIALESVLEIDRALRTLSASERQNDLISIMRAIQKRMVAVLKDVIKLESFTGNSCTDFCIETYFSGRSISAYELLEKIEKESFD